MTKAKFFVTKEGFILGFEVCDHSGYADSGEDIVCAAVSSAAYLVANTLTDIMRISADVKVDDSLGYMKLVVDKNKLSMCSDILNGLKAHLLLLEEIYSKNLKVSYVEV